MKRGRPVKYLNTIDRENANKRYRREWYYRNKENIVSNYDPKVAKIKRESRIFKGYFLIFNVNNNEAYINYSKDMTARCRDILKNLKNQDKTGTLYNRFNKNGEWHYKFLEFTEEKSDDLEDKLKNDLKNYTFI